MSNHVAISVRPFFVPGRPRFSAACTAGMSGAARRPMIETTTISSISVNAGLCRGGPVLCMRHLTIALVGSYNRVNVSPSRRAERRATRQLFFARAGNRDQNFPTGRGRDRSKRGPNWSGPLSGLESIPSGIADSISDTFSAFQHYLVGAVRPPEMPGRSGLLMRSKPNELGQFATNCPPFDNEVYGSIWEEARRKE